MAKKVETETPDPLVTVEFNGHSFSFPRDQEDWPTLAIIAASRKQYTASSSTCSARHSGTP
jgi:hypothetical protein